MKMKFFMLTMLATFGLQNQALACSGKQCVGKPAEEVARHCPVSFTSKPAYTPDGKASVILRWSEKCGVNWAVLRSSEPLSAGANVDVAEPFYGSKKQEFTLSSHDIQRYGTIYQISSPAIYGRDKQIRASGWLPNGQYAETSAY